MVVVVVYLVPLLPDALLSKESLTETCPSTTDELTTDDEVTPPPILFEDEEPLTYVVALVPEI